MRILNVPRATALAVSVALAGLVAPTAIPLPAAAQNMTNVVPDGGSGSLRGKIQSINFESRQVAVVPAAGGPERVFHAPPGVDIAGYMAGVDVSVHFSRSVHISVTPPVPGSAAPAAPGATATVGTVARSPGGFGDGASEVVASVVRVISPSEVAVVNRTGGGEYTIRTTVPSRQALIKTLKPGDVITVSVGELTLTSIIGCGLLGCL